jgi:exodeoxyribonuclease VII small subunit
MSDINNFTFEEAMTKMEEIVQDLEKNDVTLEQSMELFQFGMQLSKICNEKLSQASQKVQCLIEENGQVVLKPIN